MVVIDINASSTTLIPKPLLSNIEFDMKLRDCFLIGFSPVSNIWYP